MKNLQYLIKVIFKQTKLYFIVTMLRNAAEAIVPIIDILGLGMVVSAICENREKGIIIKVIFIYVAVAFVVSVINVLLRMVENGMMRKATNRLQYRYMKDCVSVDYHYVQNSKLLELKPKSMGARPEFFLGLWGMCFKDAVKVIGVLTTVALISPWFICILLLLSVVIIRNNIVVNHKEMTYQNDKMENERKIDYLFMTMTDCKYGKEVRINDAAPLLIKKFSSVVAEQKDKMKDLLRDKMKVTGLGCVIKALRFFMVYLYATYMCFMGHITIAEYTVLVSAVTLFIDAVISLFSNLGYVKNNFKAIEYLREYETIVNENSVMENSNSLTVRDVDYKKGLIELKNVSFSYPGSEEKVLDNVSFSMESGKKTAIVGLNGAGKSTLIQLLLRLYRPTSGEILIDGVDINSIPYDDYITQFGILLQDFTLFAYSIRENIVFEGQEDEAALEYALSASDIIDKIRKLPKGIGTPLFKDLSDDGVEFSGGESQKLALARALYRSGSIMVMDEPTGALDPIAEYNFFKRLEEMANEKTTLFVSHRLSSTTFCDQIVVLVDGKVKEIGNHQELMQLAGEYQKLFEMQAKYYEKAKKE